MDVIWSLNFVSCNFGVKSYLRFQIKLVLHTPLTLKSRKCACDFRPTNTYNNAKKILSSRKVTKVQIHVQILLNILGFLLIFVTLRSPPPDENPNLSHHLLIGNFHQENLAVEMYLNKCSQVSLTVPLISIW